MTAARRPGACSGRTPRPELFSWAARSPAWRASGPTSRGSSWGGGGDVDPAGLAAELNAAAARGTSVEAELASKGRTRALVKVQTGCEHGCAYCIVPRARGPERSADPARVMDELRRLKDAGVNEVVLTGVQIGAYGNDEPGFPRLPALLTMAADTFAPGRVRLSSVEPWSVDDALIDAVAAHPRICPHLHVPLQAGSDTVLRAMRRGYTRDEWRRRVDRAFDRIPDLCFGTDVLCGFPGEDEAAFAKTVDLLEGGPPGIRPRVPLFAEARHRRGEDDRRALPARRPRRGCAA